MHTGFRARTAPHALRSFSPVYGYLPAITRCTITLPYFVVPLVTTVTPIWAPFPTVTPFLPTPPPPLPSAPSLPHIYPTTPYCPHTTHHLPAGYVVYLHTCAYHTHLAHTYPLVGVGWVGALLRNCWFCRAYTRVHCRGTATHAPYTYCTHRITHLVTTASPCRTCRFLHVITTLHSLPLRHFPLFHSPFTVRLLPTVPFYILLPTHCTPLPPFYLLGAFLPHLFTPHLRVFAHYTVRYHYTPPPAYLTTPTTLHTPTLPSAIHMPAPYHLPFLCLPLLVVIPYLHTLLLHFHTPFTPLVTRYTPCSAHHTAHHMPATVPDFYHMFTVWLHISHTHAYTPLCLPHCHHRCIHTHTISCLSHTFCILHTTPHTHVPAHDFTFVHAHLPRRTHAQRFGSVTPPCRFHTISPYSAAFRSAVLVWPAASPATFALHFSPHLPASPYRLLPVSTPVTVSYLSTDSAAFSLYWTRGSFCSCRERATPRASLVQPTPFVLHLLPRVRLHGWLYWFLLPLFPDVDVFVRSGSLLGSHTTVTTLPYLRAYSRIWTRLPVRAAPWFLSTAHFAHCCNFLPFALWLLPFILLRSNTLLYGSRLYNAHTPACRAVPRSATDSAALTPLHTHNACYGCVITMPYRLRCTLPRVLCLWFIRLHAAPVLASADPVRVCWITMTTTHDCH